MNKFAEKMNENNRLMREGSVEEIIAKAGKDILLMNASLAFAIGNKKAVIVATMEFMAEKEALTNKAVYECFSSMYKSKESLARTLKDLENMGLISFEVLTQENIVHQLKNKKLYGRGIGDRICEWCNCRTLVRHAHHFPIPRKDGGKLTVNICTNCHREYHYLAGQAGRPEYYFYRVSHKELDKQIIIGRAKQGNILVSDHEKEYQRWRSGNKPTETESATDNPPRSGENG